MPVLIDAYNLYHYAMSVYREEGVDLSISAFCGLIDEWTRRSRQKVAMVFDGSPPPALRQNSRRYGTMDMEFAGSGCDADTIIENRVLKSTAPRLLTVVSSDRRIRKAAMRRHCRILTSDQFWVKVAARLTRKQAKPEPREKTSGMMSGELEYWLKVFGLK